MRHRRSAILGLAFLALLVAVPVLAAKPSAPPGQQKDKAPKATVTLTGTIETSSNADGEAVYTLADGGTTYTLEAGPRWFFGDNYPLQPFVGKAVTIVGEKAEGSNEVDVLSVDGTALRPAGKPPWAGGWKAVGERHPGWSQEKADRMKAKFGDCFPPGQCRDKADKAGEPDESEAPDQD
jgi:hypothetical protein